MVRSRLGIIRDSGVDPTRPDAGHIETAIPELYHSFAALTPLFGTTAEVKAESDYCCTSGKPSSWRADARTSRRRVA